MKKYVIAVVFGLICSIAIVVACMTIADVAYVEVSAKEESATESTTEAHRGIETDAKTEKVQIIEIKDEEEPKVEEKKYYACDLSEELQDHIFTESEKYGISPAVVIAMIERESKCDQYAMGDDGRAFGLMQIQPKWHLKRMIDLGCTDLLNPIENITVGINILGELQEQNANIYWVLMAYNSGAGNANKNIQSGNISNYATSVMARAYELERGM